MPMKSWTQRLLETALALAAAVWLVRWAWQVLQPLLPFLLTLAGLSVAIMFVVRRNRSW